MKNIIKKLLVLMTIMITVLSVCFTAVGCSGSNTDVYVLQYAEHGSLDNCYNGIVEGLKEKGFGNLNIKLTNAKGRDADNSAFARSIINDMPKIAVGIATPSAYALAAAAEGTNIPVVFSAVSDPVASGFDNFNNVTGSSDKLPVASQLDLIRAFMGGNEKIKIGILYSKNEQNSVSQIAEFEALEAEKNVEIVAHGVDDPSTELSVAVDAIIEQVDCFNNLTDNKVVQNMQVLLDKAAAAKKPVFGSEIEQVKKGCLASCSLDYFELGKRTGYMIAEILNGKKADDIPYLYVNDDYTVDYNSEVLTALSMTLPQDLQVNDVQG